MSREIVTDCPLTLWNLAGALDSLGKSADALSVYTWLLQTNKSPDDDPCWESKAWTDSLKADCVYRVGVCLGHLGKSKKAENCYRQYLNLLSIGIDGSYTIDDIKREFRELHRTSKSDGTASEFRKAVKATLQISGIEPHNVRRITPPEIRFGKRHRERRSLGKQ